MAVNWFPSWLLFSNFSWTDFVAALNCVKNCEWYSQMVLWEMRQYLMLFGFQQSNWLFWRCCDGNRD